MEREAAAVRPFGQGGQQGQGPAAGMNGGFAACPTFLPEIWRITIAQHARISIFYARPCKSRIYPGGASSGRRLALGSCPVQLR